MFWNTSNRLIVTAIAALGCTLLITTDCLAQTQDPQVANQFWPSLNVNFELNSRARITGVVEKHSGEDAFYEQAKFGVTFSYRMRRIRKHLFGDVDKENEYNLSVAVGYEFRETDDGGTIKHENRLLIQSTPKYILPWHILLQNRNRIEFRWIDAEYNFRYRNKLIVDVPLKIRGFRITPFTSGELFWDRNRKAWNQNQYAFGVRWPLRKWFGVDTYYMRQNCTTCTSDPLNIFGITTNLYFR
ncbi:MAG: hypothetical protein C5B55_03060 [Blastocatellia bacterium]|nr:MAG: hypothetical protein C5B55_03060 [Blastocatellia bacterium]